MMVAHLLNPCYPLYAPYSFRHFLAKMPPPSRREANKKVRTTREFCVDPQAASRREIAHDLPAGRSP